MGKIKRFIYRAGWDTIILLTLCFVAFVLIVFSGNSLFEDLCISFISAVIIYVITVSIPRCHHRIAKAIFLKDRIWQIIKGGGYLFNNISTMEYLCGNIGMAYTIFSNDEIEKACKNLDLRVPPAVFLTPDEEVSSWDLLFERYLQIINRSITEMVSIAGKEDVELLNTCEDIRKIVEGIQLNVDIRLVSTTKTASVNGRFLSNDLQILANKLRELEKFHRKMI